MLKKITVVLFLSFTSLTFSQEVLVEFKNSLKTSSSSVKGVTPIVNEENGEFALFIVDAKNVYGHLFNEKSSLLGSLSSNEKPRSYKVLLGATILKNGDHRVFLKNKRKNKFIFFNFSFKDSSSLISKKFKFLNKRERFLQAVSSKNNFYLLSVDSKHNGFYIYSFDEKGDSIRTKINTTKFKSFTHPKKKDLLNKKESLKKKHFLKKKDCLKKKDSLKKANCLEKKELLEKKDSLKMRDFIKKKDSLNNRFTNLFDFASDLKKIEENIPNPIETVSDLIKMYVKNHSIIFTDDRNPDLSQVFSINLDDYSFSSNYFDKPMKGIGNGKKKTNSYIKGNHLFTIASTKDTLSLEILDFTTKAIKQHYEIVKDYPISFKNSPIIQEGRMFDNYKEMGETESFLLKIMSGKIGVSVQEINDLYRVTLGGNAPVFFNFVQFSYTSHIYPKSTRIECSFDADFNPVKEDLLKSAFEKIKEYNFTNEKSSVIFPYKDYFIKGGYEPWSKIYTLKKFTNEKKPPPKESP